MGTQSPYTIPFKLGGFCGLGVLSHRHDHDGRFFGVHFLFLSSGLFMIPFALGATSGLGRWDRLYKVL